MVPHNYELTSLRIIMSALFQTHCRVCRLKNFENWSAYITYISLRLHTFRRPRIDAGQCGLWPEIPQKLSRKFPNFAEILCISLLIFWQLGTYVASVLQYAPFIIVHSQKAIRQRIEDRSHNIFINAIKFHSLTSVIIEFCMHVAYWSRCSLS